MLVVNPSALHKVWSLPTWLLYASTKNHLPNTHAWYRRNFSLETWHRGCTRLSHQTNLVMWVWLICMSLVLSSWYYENTQWLLTLALPLIGWTILLYFRIEAYITEIENGNRLPGS